MGFLGSLMKVLNKRGTRKTSQKIYSVYLKIKNDKPELSEKEILQLLVIYRKPFWGGNLNNVTFKNHPAFVIYDGLEIGGFIILVNIWESIISVPSWIKDQSTTMLELKVMVEEIIEIAFKVLGSPSTSENDVYKDEQIENYFNYTIDEIKKLGGKIY